MDEREDLQFSAKHRSFRQTPPLFPQQTPEPDWSSNDGLPHLRKFDPTRRFRLEVVLAETNISPTTLRAWERFYGIPTTWSGEYHQKLYSQRDVAAIRWLCKQITSNLSPPQAMVELTRHEPAYTNDRVSSILLPPPRELPEMRDKLIHAITSTNMGGATRILADAFIMYPALTVCEDLLRPVLTYTVELRKRDIIPSTTETFVSTLTRSQVPYLVAACFSPQKASEYLSSLLQQVSLSAETKQQEKISRAVPSLDEMEEPLLKALHQMDETITLRILDSAFRYYSAEDVCLHLLQPALSHIKVFQDTDITSTTIKSFSINLIYKYLSLLFQATPNLRKGLLILVCAAPQETYEIDALMLALFWRRAGLHVHYHGQLSEPKDLLEALETTRPFRPGIVYLSATKRSHIHDVKEVGREIARLKHPRPILCFGGSAFGEEANLLRGITGVYLGRHVTTHMQRLDEVIRLYPKHSPRQIEELLSPKALLTNFQGEIEAAGRLRVRGVSDSGSTTPEQIMNIYGRTSPLPGEETSSPRKFLEWRGTLLYPGSEEIRKALPGLFLVVFPVAAIAELLWNVEIGLQNTFFVDIFIAGVLALFVGNVYPLSERIQPGLIFSTRWFLRIGIILSALKFSYTSLLKSGAQDLFIVTTTVLVALGVSLFVGKLLKINPRIAALIGTGTAICGITATMAASPAIRARDDETAITLGTILCWGTVGLFLYPLINSVFHFSPAVYGVWTGATMHDLPQLVAAAQQGGGTAALNAALIVKLVRVAFIVALVFFLNIFFNWKEKVQEARNQGTNMMMSALKTFPLFVLSFFVVVLINTVISIPSWLAGPLATWPTKTFPTTFASVFLMLAIIGICTRVTSSAIKTAGIKAIVLGLITWSVQSVVVLTLASLLFH